MHKKLLEIEKIIEKIIQRGKKVNFKKMEKLRKYDVGNEKNKVKIKNFIKNREWNK